jgi:Ca-activated chloride channel family protein
MTQVATGLTARHTPLIVSQDRALIRPRWHSKRFVVARVTAPEVTRTGSRPPVNLAFVLDRSGSMDGQKIRFAAQATEEAINRLQPSDRFAVVIYDDVVETIVPGTLATPAARSEAIGRVRSIGARNMTNLSGGWLAGCEQVASALDQMASIGPFSSRRPRQRGITDRRAGRHAGELRARGVSTSTFGVGDDFDEVLLAGMASAGGGHFYFIASAAQIRDHIGSEVGETLEVVARDVTLDVTLPDGVRLESLGAFPAKARGGRTSIELDLVSPGGRGPMRVFFGFGQVATCCPRS